MDQEAVNWNRIIYDNSEFIYAEKAPYTPSGMSTRGAIEKRTSDGRVKCHECGRAVSNLEGHILLAHDLPLKEFKRKHGFRQSTKLDGKPNPAPSLVNAPYVQPFARCQHAQSVPAPTNQDNGHAVEPMHPRPNVGSAVAPSPQAMPNSVTATVLRSKPPTPVPAVPAIAPQITAAPAGKIFAVEARRLSRSQMARQLLVKSVRSVGSCVDGTRSLDSRRSYENLNRKGCCLAQLIEKLVKLHIRTGGHYTINDILTEPEIKYAIVLKVLRVSDLAGAKSKVRLHLPNSVSGHGGPEVPVGPNSVAVHTRASVIDELHGHELSYGHKPSPSDCGYTLPVASVFFDLFGNNGFNDAMWAAGLGLSGYTVAPVAR